MEKVYLSKRRYTDNVSIIYPVYQYQKFLK